MSKSERARLIGGAVFTPCLILTQNSSHSSSLVPGNLN